jgi:hypothetical protein
MKVSGRSVKNGISGRYQTEREMAEIWLPYMGKSMIGRGERGGGWSEFGALLLIKDVVCSARHGVSLRAKSTSGG